MVDGILVVDTGVLQVVRWFWWASVAIVGPGGVLPLALWLVSCLVVGRRS
jgi:hypothetical protein